jgi:hypothetical protein
MCMFGAGDRADCQPAVYNPAALQGHWHPLPGLVERSGCAIKLTINTIQLAHACRHHLVLANNTKEQLLQCSCKTRVHTDCCLWCLRILLHSSPSNNHSCRASYSSLHLRQLAP